jgi:hypothetical protein
MKDQLLSPRDAGRLLGLSTPRLQQLDREGRLRALRDSAGRRFFKRATVEAFRQKRESSRDLQRQR